MNDKILDAPFHSPKNTTKMLLDGENILWEGKPSWQHKSTLFEGNKEQKKYLIIILASMVACVVFFIFDIWMFIFFPFLGLGLIIFILMELYLYRRKNMITYIITNDRVIISYGKPSNYNATSFWNIHSFSKIEHGNGIESIVLNYRSKLPIHPAMKEKIIEEKDLDKSDAFRTLETIEDTELVKELLQKGIDTYNNYRNQ